MIDTEPIHLHFSYTTTDVQRGYRLYQRKSRRGLREKIFAGCVLLIGFGDFLINFSPTLLYGFPQDLGTYAVSIVVIILGLMLWFDVATVLGRRAGDRKRRNEPPVFYDLTFDENGAAYNSSTVSVKIAWSEIRTVYEDQFSLLLIPKQNKEQYWNIPKQYFASPRDLDVFQRLLEAHIAAP